MPFYYKNKKIRELKEFNLNKPIYFGTDYTRKD